MAHSGAPLDPQALAAALEVERTKRYTAYALVVSLTILCVGLVAATGYLVWRIRSGQGSSLFGDGRARGGVIAQLVAASPGIWDSHPDPDVGRVLQPELPEREAMGSPVSSNAFGWRERAIAVPKPEGLVRIVLLGDSFVFGPGVRADERAGVQLERFLTERVPGRRFEVIHLGMSSWNARAESEYLRRNLTNLAPDAVLQIAVSNDLDDSGGVRGFGAVADFTPQRPEQTVSLHDAHPRWGLGLGFERSSYVNRALGLESRSRYEANARHYARLAQATAAAGGGYLLVLAWADQPAIAAHYLTAGLDRARFTGLPTSFRADARYRISAGDPHWSPEGGRAVARFFYGALRARALLSKVELPAWPDADEAFASLDAEAMREAALGAPLDLSKWTGELDSAIDFAKLTERTAPQIYGGIDRFGYVSPYGAMSLARGEGTTLRVRGRMLDAVELRGATIRIFADEHTAAVLTVEPGLPIDVTFELSAELRTRPFVDVRFSSSDWVYRGPNLRQCVSLQLSKVELVP
ncbi:hypothetical protein L6R52_08630 [Myxococcota bacterium]|nr:hypothetical protein [Myxococcota bacterium]